MKNYLKCILALLFAWCSFSSEPTITKQEENKSKKSSSSRATSRKKRQRDPELSENYPEQAIDPSGCTSCKVERNKAVQLDPSTGSQSSPLASTDTAGRTD